ncbi:unnamed protein product [Toxocara canis]|uniref:Metalloendopeptidase n=1 Tax=Toxocara canis TaxID=6265 RepID=A0A3P7GC47_TOXCA|nr:unnamed protein product [Toxocara canis]
MFQYIDRSVPESETFLTQVDFELAKLGSYNGDEHVDDSKMYNSERFEGDIGLLRKQCNLKTFRWFTANEGLSARNIQRFVGDTSATAVVGVMRNAVRQQYLTWPDARIPYAISTQYTSQSRAKIAKAFDEYRRLTCIKFEPRTDADRDYIYIFPDDGCYSLVGRVGGKQSVSLSQGCFQKGVILHELMHTAGFFHEQSRADRDDYVTIFWENIKDGLADQFDKYSLRVIDHLGTKYDYSSVMHYSTTAFSKNGLPTIQPKQANAEIGQRTQFSDTDVYKLNKLYNCPSTEGGTTTNLPEEGRTNEIFPQAVRTPQPTQSTSAPSENCEDRVSNCYLLSLLGQCNFVFASKYMSNNCARTCGKCVVGSNCEDRRSWCNEWAKLGMCSWFYNGYVSETCAKSCGLC